MPDTTGSEPDVPPVVVRSHELLGPLFFVAGIVLVPWTIYLAATLPSRHVQSRYYDIAWGGFDVALAATLIATGVGLVRRRLWVQSTATAAATMLVCDAWFDILSSSGSSERIVAIALAVCVELPTVVVCILVARHVEEVAERAQRYALVVGRFRRAGERRRARRRAR